MILSQTGQTRVQGYLYVLERSLKGALPPDVVADAIREVGGHLAERIAETEAVPDERQALERVLAEVGPPLQVARAYSTELILDQAIVTGHLVPTLRGLVHIATTTIAGFFGVIGLLTGYGVGLGLILTGVLKPIFPANTGLFLVNGVPHGLGIQFPVQPGVQIVGGYWLIPIVILAGLFVFVVTHRLARRLLSWARHQIARDWRTNDRREPAEDDGGRF